MASKDVEGKNAKSFAYDTASRATPFAKPFAVGFNSVFPAISAFFASACAGEGDPSPAGTSLTPSLILLISRTKDVPQNAAEYFWTY